MRDLLLVVPPGRYGYLTAVVIFYCCSPSVASLFRDKSDLCLVIPAGRYGHLTAVVIFPLFCCLRRFILLLQEKSFPTSLTSGRL